MRLRHPFPRRLPAWILSLPLASLGLQPLHAETSPWYVGTAVNYQHDSNVLRLADGVSPQTDYSKSDDVLSTSLVGGLDQPMGRQRLFGSGTVRSNRYSRNGVYNNQGYAASLGLDWSSVERLSGNLNYSASRTLASFNLLGTGTIAEKNMESVQSIGASARWGLVSLLTLDVSAGQRRVTNSLETGTNAAAAQARNYLQDTGSVGVAWHPAAASSFGLALRDTRGRYPRFAMVGADYVADRLVRRDVDFVATLQPSGASSVDLRLSSSKTRYDLNTKRDFSGVTGSFGWDWNPSGKLHLNTRIGRDTGQDMYSLNQGSITSTADYSRLTTQVTTRADYAISAKFTVSLTLNYTDQGTVRLMSSALGDQEDTGRDRLTLATLGASWQPMRSTQLGCSLGNESRRGTGQLGSTLHWTAFSCFGQLTLQ